jgi:NiFe hydrogenase
LEELRAGRTRTWSEFTVPQEAVACGFQEAVRGMLSHHLVVRDGKIAHYHPYAPTPWNGSVRDEHGTPGPYEDAVQNTAIFEENGPEAFKGIDIMRTVRSFDPCLNLRRPHGPRSGARCSRPTTCRCSGGSRRRAEAGRRGPGLLPGAGQAVN